MQENKIQKDRTDTLKTLYTPFAIEKAEKIAKAIYLVTDRIEARDPLKWRMREMALDLLKDISKVATELKAALGIGEMNGFFSTMNKAILIREIDILQAHVTDLEPVDLSRGFFTEAVAPKQTKPAIKDIYRTNPIRSVNVADFKAQLESRMTTPSPKGQDASDTDDRKEKILSVAREIGYDGSSFSIKDITERMSDCSEKTVQRELTHMVAVGVLMKEGERRWSRYRVRQ